MLCLILFWTTANYQYSFHVLVPATSGNNDDDDITMTTGQERKKQRPGVVE